MIDGTINRYKYYWT